MGNDRTREISRILKSWSDGDRQSRDELIASVYEELHKIAAQYLRRERSDHTLQPTALVHEAYLKIVDISDITWQDRAHFFAVSSNVMRQILVDYARARETEKRGRGFKTIALEDAISFSEDKTDVDLLALDEALEHLSTFDPQQSRIVELRFFGGLTIEETAEVQGISPATVKREWTVARSWLYRKIHSGDESAQK
jgi:RNA polymerase sigma factor (TIGR02999 family)